MTVRPPSLRGTLLLWLLLPLLLIAPVAAAIQYGLILRPALKAFDRSLGDAVVSIANFVRPGPAGVAFEMSAQTERSIRTAQDDAVYYVVLNPAGDVLAGDPPLAEPRLRLATDEWQFYDAQLFDQPVRVGARGVACGEGVCQVRVAETRTSRDLLRSDMLVAIGASLLLVAVASGLTVLVATAHGLRPLQRLSQQLGARSLDDLRPLQPAGVPTEALPVVEAMNRLFERVQAGSAAQQAFLADAAHQLRTPLATLKTEAELAMLQPHPPALAAPLARINAAADRAARLSSQLLALARTDASARDGLPLETLDLKALASACVDEWVPRALQAGVDLGFELHPAVVTGQPFLLRELLGNLIHNAIVYAGAGSQVTVRSAITGGLPVLEVEDNGPGIAAEDRPRVIQRFQRGPQATGSGSGLGLAIVNDIARAHGAELLLESARARPGSDAGLRVRVVFAAAAGLAPGAATTAD